MESGPRRPDPPAKLRIYQVIASYFPLVGGAERATGDLCKALIEEGHQVEIFTTFYKGLAREEVIEGVRVHRMGTGGRRPLRSLTFGLHTIWHVIWHSANFDLIHTQNLDTPTLIGIAIKLLTGKPWVATIHSSVHIPAKDQKPLGRIRLAMMKRLANHYISICQPVKDTLVSIGIPANQISDIPNGLDLNVYSRPPEGLRNTLRLQHGYPIGDIIVLFLGRMVRSKRADLLLSALSQLQDGARVSCIVAGDGSHRAEVEALCDSLELTHQVTFAGMVQNARDYYWMSDIYVLPSTYEALPVALLEAMACGLPVVVSECEGNLSAVSGGETGLTFPVDDTEALAARLETYIRHPRLRQQHGTAARCRISDLYDIRKIAWAHIAIYFEMLGVESPLTLINSTAGGL